MPGNNNINPDLVKERKNCTFNVEELAEWCHGGKEKLFQKRYLEKVFLNDPELQDDIPLSYLSQKELYEESLKKTIKCMEKFKMLKNSGDKVIKDIEFAEILQSGILQDCPFHVHYVMFIPIIMSQGTSEQQDKWFNRAWNNEIIGAYAQTELGHGTFIRGLETRADYDRNTEQFILNTPKLTSYKWWPGALAHSSNHAIVMAQLYIDQKNCGIQPFIVQLRDEETHMPLSGIDVGNIGSKLGLKNVDNGFLGLKNVRIPRENMLMKNSQVLRDGTFVKSKSAVLTYGTMTFVRVTIVELATKYLMVATTIATRYSAVRRQSPIDPSLPEPQIIDHVAQKEKLFPQIAKTFIFKLTANNIWNMYYDVSAELDAGRLERLAELHALSCCLKAVCSSDVSKGIEILRLACGGHGYMESSNLPTLYGLTTAACTYEGENTVMLLQTARYLMKAWGQVLRGENLPPSTAYLKHVLKTKIHFNGTLSTKNIIEAFEYASAQKIRLAFEHLEERKNLGYSAEEASNMTSLELIKAAELYCRTYILTSSSYELQLEMKKVSKPLQGIFQNLFELFAIDQALHCLGDLLRFCNLEEKNINALQVRLEQLLEILRPNAVGIVDGFDIPDGLLRSTLGAYDGNVYERIYADAKKCPLNREPVNKSFGLYLKPFMKANL